MKISSYQNRPYIKNNMQEHKIRTYNANIVNFNGIKWKNPIKQLINFFSMPDIDISFNKQEIENLQEGIEKQLYKKKKKIILFTTFPKTYTIKDLN